MKKKYGAAVCGKMYLTHESGFSWLKNKLSFCCKRQNLSKSFGRKPWFFWMGTLWFVRGLKEKNALLQWKKIKEALQFFDFWTFFCLAQDNGCSDRIWTCGLWIMSPASDQTALHCDKIESTELLHPGKSFTIYGGIEPLHSILSRFLPSLHALRLLAGDFYVIPKTPFFVPLQTL